MIGTGILGPAVGLDRAPKLLDEPAQRSIHHRVTDLVAGSGQRERSSVHVAAARRLLDRFGTGLQYVLVRNQVRGPDFSGLEQSGEQSRAIGMGASVVSVKKLNEHVIQKIDAASSSFWQAKASDKDSTGLGLMDRQRVKMWLRDVYREIDEVGV